MEQPYYGVYRVFANGKTKYVPRTVTSNQKLAEEFARDLSEGKWVKPDGSTQSVPAHPHIAKLIKDDK